MGDNVWRRLLLVAALALGGLSHCGPRDAGQGDAVGAEAGPLECPEGLVLWPEHGVCAPHVDQCEAWEMPLVGGGCLAIGPRACPKAWDSEASANCEPGELIEYDGSACPEGFVLTEDEVACIPFFEENCGDMEIPVLGGGCQKVGPEWASGDGAEPPGLQIDEPVFDECPEGLLALAGGGCIQVGPRACPKLWDPDSDADCEVGDILPCPEGWQESEDGMYCDPGYDECPFGERPLLGGGCHRVVPLAEDCPPGPFPDAPEGATDVAYVSAASACAEDCGSIESPYPNISSALAAAPEGGHVLVGAGVYDEGLAIDKPVHVVGICAAKTVISGAAELPEPQESPLSHAGIAVVGVQDVHVSGLGVVSPAVGVAVVGAKQVVIEKVEIEGTAGMGVYVGHKSAAELASVWIHDTEPGEAAWMYGYGVLVEKDSQAVVSETLVENAVMAGVSATDAGTEVEIAQTTVRSTQTNQLGTKGCGLVAQTNAVVSMTDVVLEKNHYVGLYLRNGASASVGNSVIRDTKLDQEAEYGWGMVARYGATAVISGCLFEGNRGAGVAPGHSGTRVEISGTVVRDTKPDQNGMFGTGMQVTEGATAAVSGCLFEQNTEAGVAVGHSGTQVELSGTVVRDTKPAEDDKFGNGMLVSDGATAVVSGCLFEQNTDAGVAVDRPGTQVEISDTVVRDTKSDANSEFGMGVRVSDGAAATVSGCLFEGNKEIGVWVADSGTQVEISGTVVRDTKPDDNGEFGRGMQVSEGATAMVSGCLFEGNTSVGVAVGHSGTQVELSGTVVRDTKPDENGELGRGMQVQDGATATVSGCLFEGNTDIGVAVGHSGTQVKVSGTVVRDTKPNENGEFGRGMTVQEGPTATVLACLFEGNTQGGIMVADSGTQVELSGTVVRDTKPNENGEFGRGMAVVRGATATVWGCLFEGNTDIGVAVGHSGTQVKLSGTVVRDTKPDENSEFGFGMQASDGATATVWGCLFEGNTSAGVVVGHSGAQVELSGTVVRDTKSNAWGYLGVGLAISQGAEAGLSMCLFQRNTTNGVAAFGEGTALGLDTCAILDTHKGGQDVETEHGSEFQVFGDGVLVAEGGTAAVTSTVIIGNSRAGVFYHESSGEIRDTMIGVNSSYGLAMQSCEKDVKHEENGNFIFGNAFELPEEMKAQVTTEPMGMPVPEPPEAAEVSFGQLE